MVAKRGHMYYILLLAALGAYVFNIVQEGAELSHIAEQKKANLRKRQMVDERLLAVTKSTWKECRERKMTADDCKAFIDLEIFNLFTERDKYIRSVIMGKRRKTDKYYNAVTIYIGDNDMVEGLLGDGVVTYEFGWEGSGEKATEEQQAAIPPITAMEPGSSLTDIGLGDGTVATIPPIDPIDATASETQPTPGTGGGGADPAPTEDTFEYATYVYDDDTVLEEPPLVVFDEVIEGVSGSTVDQFIAAESTEPTAGAGTDDAGAGTPEGTTTDTNTTAPIAGGVLTDGTAQSTPEGDAKIQTALAEVAAAGDTVPEAGSRTIGPFNCSGMSGIDCCAYIKLQVPDSDIQGNAIQCTLNYSETSKKKKYWNNLRGKKVHIFENHNGLVSKDPKIVGAWPKSLEGADKLAEFEAWLRDAGSLPLIMQ